MELDGPKEWIEAAAKNQGIPVSAPSLEEGARVIRLVRDRFIVDGTARWWWDSLKLPCRTFDCQTIEIAEIAPQLEGDVYLIPESFEFGLIYRLAGMQVEDLLNDCPLFEYSIVNRECTWLLSENHHNVIFLCEWEESPN